MQNWENNPSAALSAPADPSAAAPTQTTPTTPYAGFFVRLAAFSIDSLLLFLLLLFVRLPKWTNDFTNPDTFLNTAVLFRHTVWDILIYLLWTAYFVLLTYFTGQTLGKKLLCIHVSTPTGEKPTLFTVLYRETIGKYLSGILCIGYIVAGIDKQKRGFHDMLADTRVVYLFGKRTPPLRPVTHPPAFLQVTLPRSSSPTPRQQENTETTPWQNGGADSPAPDNAPQAFPPDGTPTDRPAE